MSEMIERVAKTMWERTRWHPDMPGFAHEHSWADAWPPGYESFRGLILTQARAAIEGMREPTDDMVHSGHLAMCLVENEPCVDACRRMWREMVDDALEDEALKP